MHCACSSPRVEASVLTRLDTFSSRWTSSVCNITKRPKWHDEVSENPPTVWLYSTWKVDEQNQTWKNSIAIYLKIPSSAFKVPGPLAKRWTCCLMSKSILTNSVSLSDSQLLKLWANGLLRFPLRPLPTFPIHILVIKSSWSAILYIPSCSIEDSYPCHISIISYLALKSIVKVLKNQPNDCCTCLIWGSWLSSWLNSLSQLLP